jgi:hypothetical protein
VPAEAFKPLELYAGGSERPEAIFRTSGTTRGRRRARPCTWSRDWSSTAARSCPPFKAHVLAATGAHPLRVADPAPGRSCRTRPSRSWWAPRRPRSPPRSHWLVDGEAAGSTSRRSAAAFTRRCLPRARARAAPRHRARAPERARAPRGGAALTAAAREPHHGDRRLQGRRLARSRGSTCTRRLAGRTGVPAERIVSEYGMTELLSQLYEPVLSDGPGRGRHARAAALAAGAGARPNHARGAARRKGRRACSASSTSRTSGLGVPHPHRGRRSVVERARPARGARATGAEPRGCSRAMDELMSAACANR